MALAIDASSPAAVRDSNATTTTASFSPPANALLVAFVHADANNASTDEACTVTSTGGLTWQLDRRNNGTPGATVEIWHSNTTDTPPGSITVSVTDNKGSVAKSLFVRVFTSASGSIPTVGQTVTGLDVNVLTYTAAATNSWGWYAGFALAGAVTPATGCTVRDSVTDSSFDGGDNLHTISRTDPDGISGAFTTTGSTGSGSGHSVAVEILDALTGEKPIGPPIFAAPGPIPAFVQGVGPNGDGDWQLAMPPSRPDLTQMAPGWTIPADAGDPCLPAFVQKASQTGTGFSVAATLTNAVKAGALLVAFVTTDASGAACTFTDDTGGTWRNCTASMYADTVTLQRIIIGYSMNHPAAGATTVTATFDGSSSFMAIHAAEFANIATVNALHQASVGNSVVAGGHTAITDATTLAPGADKSLIVSCAIVNADTDTLPGPGFAGLRLNDPVLFNSEYQIQGTATNVAPSFAQNADGGILSAAFRSLCAQIWIPGPQRFSLRPIPALIRRARATSVISTQQPPPPPAYTPEARRVPRRVGFVARTRVEAMTPPAQAAPVDANQEARQPRQLPFRRGKATNLVPPQFNPPYPLHVEAAPKRLRGLPRRGRVLNLVPPQFNPPYPWRVDGARRPLRGIWRRGEPLNLVPAQQNPPYPWQVLAQKRRQRGLLIRRGRPLPFVPAQEAPVLGTPVINNIVQPRRARGALIRRGKMTFVVPAQLNPPYPFAVIAAARRLRGWLIRRGHALPFVPEQVTPAVAVPVIGNIAQPRRPRGLPSRRPHMLNVVGPQLNPPYPWAVSGQPRRTRGLLYMRGNTITVVQAQLNPPYPHAAMHQSRALRGALIFRGNPINLTRSQVNPPYPFTIARQPLRYRGWRQFRGRPQPFIFEGYIPVPPTLTVKLSGQEKVGPLAGREPPSSFAGFEPTGRLSGNEPRLTTSGVEPDTSLSGKEEGTLA